MDRPPRSPVLRYLVLALALALPLPAAGATFSNVSITLDAGVNSLDFSDDAAPDRSVNLSSASVLASSPGSFSTRYAAVVGADIGGAGANDLTQSLTASFTISFEVTAGAGVLWDVVLDFGRAGAMTVVSDGNGDASVTLGALSGAHAGEGALSGSLALGALSAGNTGNQGQSPNVPFAQTGSATISGTGTGAAQLVSISFSFTASATSNDRPGGAVPEGDEAALRLGMTSSLSAFAADDYPGAGARDPNGDGFVLTATLVPEPDTAVLISLGLGGLAVMGSDRRLRRPA